MTTEKQTAPRSDCRTPDGRWRKGFTPLGARPFRPGVSGNPRGRPHGIDMKLMLSRALSADGQQRARELIDAVIEKAKENPTFFREIMTRLHGHPAAAMPDLAEGGQPIKAYLVASPEEWSPKGGGAEAGE